MGWPLSLGLALRLLKELVGGERMSQAQALWRRHGIVALDVDTFEQAVDLVELLGAYAVQYKVGSRLFASCGPSILRWLGESGKEVFLDLKYHDIPSVVGDAVAQISALYPQVRLVTVHALGGEQMIEAAVKGAGDQLQVIAVTALTSMRPEQLGWLGFGHESVAQLGLALGSRAVEAGAAGVVCSAQELELLRPRLGSVCYVTPGIRPAGWRAQGAADDQARVMTPRAALEAGSDRLVVGRPIVRATDPLMALLGLIQSLTVRG